jgi:hypothetical protein
LSERAAITVILSRVDGEGTQNTPHVAPATHFEVLRRASPAQDDGKTKLR